MWIVDCGPIKVRVKKFVTEISIENLNLLDKKRSGIELPKE